MPVAVVFFTREAGPRPEVAARLDGHAIRLVVRPSLDGLVALMNLADAFVFPSFYEGFGLPLVEALSVIAQVVSYRGFRRRVLRMAPIHHHFEVGGWPETTVIVRLWLFSGAFVALGLGLFYADFIKIPGVIE